MKKREKRKVREKASGGKLSDYRSEVFDVQD